jgi:hypothetical protein
MKKNSNKLAVVGFVLMIPAIVLVSSGVLRFEVPSVLIHPVAVMSGLLVGLLVNTLAVLRVSTEHEPSGNALAITVRIGSKALNLAAVAMSLLLLSMILAYAFIENFHPR